MCVCEFFTALGPGPLLGPTLPLAPALRKAPSGPSGSRGSLVPEHPAEPAEDPNVKRRLELQGSIMVDDDG